MDTNSVVSMLKRYQVTSNQNSAVEDMLGSK